MINLKTNKIFFRCKLSKWLIKKLKLDIENIDKN